MKNLITLIAVAGIGSAAIASTNRHHVVAELHRATPESVTHFAQDLSFALNELRSCPAAVRNQAHYGTQITDVTYTDNRNGVRVSTLKATGSNPAPSFQPYQVTITISSRPVARRRGAPIPSDAPGARAYRCSVQRQLTSEE